MSIDGDAAALIGVFCSALSGAVTYGAMKEKIKRLEMDTDKNENKYVTMQVFNAVIPPIQRTVDEMERDIKKILQIVSKIKTKAD